ncbi:MAG: hypothetical protein ABI467_30100 [Kofleriaceae bacterium]
MRTKSWGAMAQPTDTSVIQRLIGRTRLRIRAQWALEGATTATVIASATALVSIFLVRSEAVAPGTGIAMLIAAGTIIALAAAISAARKLDDERVARRIDRASNLSDRLSTAIAFSRSLAARPPTQPPAQPPADGETEAMMTAAIKDGVRSAARADVRAAAPFAWPRDLRAALGFLVLSAVVAGLSLPTVDRGAKVYRALPDHAPPGAEITIEGANLMTGLARPLAALPLRNTMGAPQLAAPTGGAAAPTQTGFVPTDAAVYLGTLAKSRPVQVLDWSPTQIMIQLPNDAPLGDQQLLVFIANDRVGMVDFTVVDPKDVRYHKQDSVALDPDEKAYIEAILAELRDVAQRDKVPELEDFAKKIEDLLAKAEDGEISKEQLLDALSKAEDALAKDADPKPEEIAKQLGDAGKELSKEQLTKELGDALQNHDLDKAKQELEKLADKLDQKQLSEQQKQDLQKKLEQVAKDMQQQDKQQDDKQQQQQQQLKDQIRRLEQQKDQAKNDQQRQDMERRLEDKQRELQKLQKDQDQKQQSDQRRAVKRLEKDMEKAAENLQKPQKDPDKPGDQQDQEQKDKQASQSLKDAARETGRVDKDQRKQATQKKMGSQMDDLREAMRRAKQKGNKGPNDPFNKTGKNQDFISRARGGKGQGGQWKPGQQGQGQGQGQQGQGQNGGQGSGQGGDTWGTGHDDNLTGDETHKTGHDKDQELQGASGDKGGSTRETILAAAQKGFASVGYQKVYANYQRIVEEVMRTEKLPSSYKYYVKRYFANIHPNMAAPPEGSK